jgi:2-methylcitrate dehydratase PrpD
MRIIDKIVRYLIETDYKALPPDVIEVTRKQILDTLAATVAGSTCSISGEMNGLVDMVRDWGGKEESTILAFGGRVPAPSAAFVNAVSSVRLDFDDTLVTWINLHSSRAIVPTAFAMAERQGRINGKQFITAVALGYDLACRVKQAAGYNADNAIRFTSNFFGAAATAGLILGLNNEEMKNALFLAYHQMSGAGSTGGGGIGFGASLKGLSNGFAAKAGIISALLAGRGFTAAADFLDAENKNNYYQMFCGGSYLPWILTLDLGKVFAASNTSLKEYPCCHGQHAAIEAALALMKEHQLKPSDIAEVTLRLSPVDFASLANPLESKQNPQNIIETQFSLCWGVASAIVYGEVGIKNFSAEALKDAKVRKMARKVLGKVDTDMAREQGFPAAAVDIKTGGGDLYSRQVDHAFGTVGNPMTLADVISKFRYCCGYSVYPIPPKNQDEVIGMIEGLEKVKDVGRIARLLG